MREEKFKMERQGLIQVGDKVKISEFLSATNYSYIIEPAVAMSGCYRNADRIRSMSDEELAGFLIHVETLGYNDSSVSGKLEMIEWIQSEVEE